MKKENGLLHTLFAIGVCFVESMQEVVATVKYTRTGKYDANKYVVERTETGVELFKKNPRAQARED